MHKGKTISHTFCFCFTSMSLKTKNMEAKRQRVSDLLAAHLTPKEIIGIVKCSRSLIDKVKRLKKTGGGLGRKVGSGGKNKKRTEDFLIGVASEIEADGSTSYREMGKALGVSKNTVWRACKDLGASSYVRRRRQLLTEATKANRVMKGKKLLNLLKKQGSTVRIFSDKKNWNVDQSRNSQNDRFLACVEDVPPINSTKHPQSAMMLGVVASDGKRMPPNWFPKGLRLDTKEYLKVMENVVKPWINANSLWKLCVAAGQCSQP